MAGHDLVANHKGACLVMVLAEQVRKPTPYVAVLLANVIEPQNS